MKISFCSIAFRKNHTALHEVIPKLAQYGYDGLELWGNHVSGGLWHAQEIKNEIDTHGLAIPMISPYFDFTGTRRQWAESVEVAVYFIDIARALEAPLVRVFTGVVGSKEATKDQWRTCVAGLKRVAALAERQGVALALETHPGTLVDSVESTLDLLERVDAPNLKVNLDIYHLWEVYQDPILILDLLYPHVAHVHAKNAFFSRDIKGRNPHPFLHDRRAAQKFVGIAPLPDGEMNYGPFLRALGKRGFKGFVSVEWFGENILETAEQELQYLRGFASAH